LANLVRLSSEVAELVSARDLDRRFETAGAEASEPGGELGHGVDEASAERQREREHRRETRETDPESVAPRDSHGVRCFGEGPAEPLPVEGRDLRQSVGGARLFDLHGAHGVDDGLTRFIGDETPRNLERGGVIVVERDPKGGRVLGLDRIARRVELLEKMKLELTGRRQRLRIVGGHRVLKSTSEAVECALELRLENDLGKVTLLDHGELALDSRGDEPAGDDDQDERGGGHTHDGQQFRSKSEAHELGITVR
jgi:hypothetical protein